MPYFRILVNDETLEAKVTHPRTLIGREKPWCDVLLPDPAVSRQHCLLAKLGDEYVVFDLHSRLGTVLNGKKITRARLKHGDNLVLGATVMEFRTDNSRSASLVDLKDAEEGQLLENFRMLPSGIKVRYRLVFALGEELFCVGDTRMVGQGGVLMPVNNIWDLPRECLFELELTWPDGTKKNMLGEIIARLEKLGLVCLKMHAVDWPKYEVVLSWAKRGQWQNVTIH